MKMRTITLAMAVIGGAASLVIPATASAGNVGYYNTCTSFTIGDPASAITTAGHTKVTVTTLDTASLAGLNALIITDCYSGVFNTPNPALNTAVANGMGLVVESLGAFAGSNTSLINSTGLPGAPTFSASSVYAFPEADDMSIPAGSPVTTGPGGTLTATSLDRIPANAGGTFNFPHYYPASSLPAGAIPFATTSNPDHVGGFGYMSGTGRVAFTDSQASSFLPGGFNESSTDSFGPGLVTYFTNLIFWAAGGNQVATTCASSGYTGTKLNWCRIICESEASSSTVDTYLRRWINKYRDLPYCAVEGGGEEPPPQGG